MESASKGSETSAGEQFAPSNKQDPNQSVQLTIQEASTARTQKSGGPRTQEGKENSKHNALKHGIFSQVALLKGEQRAKFDSLLSGLREVLEPEGALEELLVDKLVTLVWRHRRLIIADGEHPLKGRGLLEFNPDIADVPLLDLLLRYESNLERAFDRALNQLKRLQRIRKGQPVPPTLNVNVSA